MASRPARSDWVGRDNGAGAINRGSTKTTIFPPVARYRRIAATVAASSGGGCNSNSRSVSGEISPSGNFRRRVCRLCRRGYRATPMPNASSRFQSVESGNWLMSATCRGLLSSKRYMSRARWYSRNGSCSGLRKGSVSSPSRPLVPLMPKNSAWPGPVFGMGRKPWAKARSSSRENGLGCSQRTCKWPWL